MEHKQRMVEIRKSNLPFTNEGTYKTTNEELKSLPMSKSAFEEQKSLYEQCKSVKPRFSLGNDGLNYQTSKDVLVKPTKSFYQPKNDIVARA